MPSPSRTTLLAAAFLLVAAPRAQGLIFNEATDTAVVVNFQFDPTPAMEPWVLVMSFPSSLFPGSPGYQGCIFELHDGGGMISSNSISSIFGCNTGFWFSDGGNGSEFTVDTNVDLSGIAAGEAGSIRYRPTFVGPGGHVSLDPPALQFSGSPPATIISNFVVPEPSLALMAVALVSMLAVRRTVPAPGRLRG